MANPELNLYMAGWAQVEWGVLSKQQGGGITSGSLGHAAATLGQQPPLEMGRAVQGMSVMVETPQ